MKREQYHDLNKQIHGFFTNGTSLEDIIKKSSYFFINKEQNKMLFVRKDIIVLVDCIYCFIYKQKCKDSLFYIYKLHEHSEFLKKIWSAGVRKTIILGEMLLVAMKYQDALFNKHSQISKYEEEYLEDTLNMLHRISQTDRQVPENLSLKNLHDDLSLMIDRADYIEHEKNYIKNNENVVKFTGTYLDKKVIFPKDIDEHCNYGKRFRNCILSYIPQVNKEDKIVYVYSSNDKPVYCAYISLNLKKREINIKQCTKVNNEKLTSEEERELNQLLKQAIGG